MSTYSRSGVSFLCKCVSFLAVLSLLPSYLRSQTTPSQQAPQPEAGGLAPTGPKFRVLRSVAGTSGTQSGDKLIIDNPQTVFHLNQDHKVIVYFEWEGPIGQHKFEGLWKNPDGNVVMVSDFAYTATGTQFAGYWTMLLSGSEVVGIWTLQARIDGEDAGSFPFQLVTEPGAPAPPPPPPEREPLAPDELYKKALNAIVFVDKYDANGKVISRGSGFCLDDGRLVTAYYNIDGAKYVRVTLADGQTYEVAEVLAWNRWQDWAILQSDPLKVQGLMRAQSRTSRVGSKAYYLEASTGAGRIIGDADIVGDTNYPRSGERFNIDSSPTDGAIGGPVFDGFGDVIGMIGGSLVPGTNLTESFLLVGGPGAATSTVVLRYGLAVPINLISASGTSGGATSFEQMSRTGQMISPLFGQSPANFGTFTLSINKAKGLAFPPSGSLHYSHSDSSVYVYVNWDLQANIKGAPSLSLYDADNHVVPLEIPSKVDFHSRQSQSNYWQIGLSTLPSGIYRVDVALGGQVIWRSFFRLDD